MSTHNEIFNAMSDAMAAFRREPELVAELKAARDERDFKQLELDEARERIAKLETFVNDYAATIQALRATVQERDETISDLRSRNNDLESALNGSQIAVRNLEATNAERELEIKSLTLTAQSLTDRLADAKSYGSRLADALKGIGQTIVAAVEAPEVATEEKPFPVDHTVGLPSSSNLEGDVTGNVGSMDSVVEPAGQDMEPVTTDKEKVAAGCNVYRYW